MRVRQFTPGENEMSSAINEEHNIDRDGYRNRWRNPVMQTRFEICLKQLARKPTLDNDTLARFCGGDVSHIASDARKILGIKIISRGPARIDYDTYQKWCAILGVPPVKGEVHPRNFKKKERAPEKVKTPEIKTPVEMESPVRVPEIKISSSRDLKALVELVQDEMRRSGIDKVIICPLSAQITRVITEDI